MATKIGIYHLQYCDRLKKKPILTNNRDEIIRVTRHTWYPVPIYTYFTRRRIIDSLVQSFRVVQTRFHRRVVAYK